MYLSTLKSITKSTRLKKVFSSVIYKKHQKIDQEMEKLFSLAGEKLIPFIDKLEKRPLMREIAKDALRYLMKDDCSGKYSISSEKEYFIMDTIPSCKTIKENLKVKSIGSYAILSDAEKAYEYVASQCKKRKPVILGLVEGDKTIEIGCHSVLNPLPKWLKIPETAVDSEKKSNAMIYIEHDSYKSLLTSFKNNDTQDAAKLADMWWKDYLANEELMAAISNAKPGQKDFQEYLKKKLSEKSADLPNFIKNAEVVKLDLSKRAEASLKKLANQIPFGKPIDIYYVIYLHLFDGKEFIAKDGPSFALNLAFPGWKDRSDGDMEKTFVHEGFHVLHLRKAGEDLFKTPEGLVYREGLAVLVTEELLGGSAAENAFLKGEDIRKIDSNIKTIAKAMTEAIKKGYEKTNRLFLVSSTTQIDWPARSGYHVGKLAIKAARDGRSLNELLTLSPDEYHKMVMSGLNKLVNGDQK